MYQLGYRCDVTGAQMTTPLPKRQFSLSLPKSADPVALVSRKCDYPNDVSNCTVGGKQPHYWLQAESVMLVLLDYD